MIKAATLENRFETDLVTAVLDEEGLEYVIKSFQDTAFDGLYVPRKGYALLLVDELDKERAEEIVAQVRESVDRGDVVPGPMSEDETDDPEDEGDEPEE